MDNIIFALIYCIFADNIRRAYWITDTLKTWASQVNLRSKEEVEKQNNNNASI